jgi:hypothetical protein
MTERNPAEESKPSGVGYCKPPQNTRFRKGESGNPKGRPKGTLNLATVLERTLRERIVINESGRRKAITKLEAAIKQLANKAASGELKALQLLATLVRTAQEHENQQTAPNSVLDEVDEKVVAEILRRLEASDTGNNK